MRRRWISIAAALVGVGTLAVAALSANAGVTRAGVSPASCAFDLKIGDVLPFTGDLAAYGANLDRAVKVAVGLQNKSLAAAGMTGAIRSSSSARRTGRRRPAPRSRPRRS